VVKFADKESKDLQRILHSQWSSDFQEQTRLCFNVYLM